MSSVETPIAEKRSPNRAHRVSFTVAIACISRALILRDQVFGWSKLGRSAPGIHERAVRHVIASGTSRLDAVFVEPLSVSAHAAVLLCHGIGETVEQWLGVQQVLAAGGVASLVFDYSGYGKSTGRPDFEQLERDAHAAFAVLEKLAPQLPLTVLGFSLGSGVAAATINQLGAHRLVLCEAFTSFCDAAVAGGIPKPLARLVPPIWRAQEALASCRLPILVVHGEKDRLFPVMMAAELAGFCSPRAQVILIPDTGHNQPFRKPHLSYWGPIIEWVRK
jgi:uncharacterized protein